jgi:uncharacterized protein (TIGR00369 family)
MSYERQFTWEDPAIWQSARDLSGLECLQRAIAGAFPPPPMARLMDIILIEVTKGRAVFAASPSDFHYNPLGTVHGGFGATLLDSAMGCAVHSTLEAGDLYTTLELKVNFLRPLMSGMGEVRGIGQVINTSRSTALAEGRIEGADGKLYGFATCTCLIKRATG